MAAIPLNQYPTSYLSKLRRPVGGRPSQHSVNTQSRMPRLPSGVVLNFLWNFKGLCEERIQIQTDVRQNLLSKLFDEVGRKVPDEFLKLYASIDGRVQELLTEEMLLKAIYQSKNPIEILTPEEQQEVRPIMGPVVVIPPNLYNLPPLERDYHRRPSLGRYLDNSSPCEQELAQPTSPTPSPTPSLLSDDLNLEFDNDSDDERAFSPQPTFEAEFYKGENRSSRKPLGEAMYQQASSVPTTILKSKTSNIRKKSTVSKKINRRLSGKLDMENKENIAPEDYTCVKPHRRMGNAHSKW